jgi:PhoD related phosphatase
MIGGGDQIYNDGVRVSRTFMFFLSASGHSLCSFQVKGPLKKWADIANPKKRRDYAFGGELRAQCDKYYFENYVRWYSTEPFASANASIPQVNIWDDHDIIDGVRIAP